MPAIQFKAVASDAEKAVRNWAASGWFFPQKNINIQSIEAWAVPMIDVTCNWSAEWKANVGEVDNGRYNMAVNAYQTAVSEHHRAKPKHGGFFDDMAHLNRHPRSPWPSDFLSWYDTDGEVTGYNIWKMVCAVDPPHPKIAGWCGEIGKSMTIGEDNGDIVRRFCERPEWPMVKDRLSGEVSEAMNRAIMAQLPKHYRGLRWKGSRCDWEVSRLSVIPVYVVEYSCGRKKYLCAVDGVGAKTVKGARIQA